MFEAQARGVILDVGHGAASLWFRNAVRAIAGGFQPNSISTDLHMHNVHGVVVDMQTTLSKFLNMGLSLPDVIRLASLNPAIEIGHPELGHLSVGAGADVAVFQLQRGQYSFIDCGRAKLMGDKKLECALTIRNGEILYDIGGLSAPEWTQAPPEYWGLPA